MSTLILKNIKDIYHIPQKENSQSILIQGDRIERIGPFDAIHQDLVEKGIKRLLHEGEKYVKILVYP